MSHKIRVSVSVLATAALAATLAGLGSPAPGSHLALAQRQRAVLGATPATRRSDEVHDQVDFRVYLQRRGGDAAERYARAVSTRASKYGKFLTPAQFRTRFSPSTPPSARVRPGCGAGLHGRHVPTNHKYVEAVGTVGQAAKAFATSFATYRVQGQTMRSNTTPLQRAASLPQRRGRHRPRRVERARPPRRQAAAARPAFRNAPAVLGVLGREDGRPTHPTPDGTGAAGTARARSRRAATPERSSRAPTA